jgi:hypothetical protein
VVEADYPPQYRAAGVAAFRALRRAVEQAYLRPKLTRVRKRREEDRMEPTNGMESEATETGAGATLPRAANLPAGPKLEGEVERNPIFDALVGSDGGKDVACLVAYSIYKQNKRAWLDNFVKATGRGPSEAETRSYIIGESTERRLATYRRLAASKLAGDAPSRSAWRAKGPMSGTVAAAVWALAIIVALGVVGLAIHASNFAGAK